MTWILEAVLVKFVMDKVKEKATSDLTDAAWQPITGLIESGQEKILEAWGHMDSELADVLMKATAESYVAAMQEITWQYFNNQKHKTFRASSDLAKEEVIKRRVEALVAKPSHEIVPRLGTTGISPASGIGDDKKLTLELMAKVSQDLGELPEELRQRFEERLLRYLRQQLWTRLSKSLKDKKGSALMSAFLFDMLSRVGAASEAAESYAARLAGQMALEFQLDRFDIDQDLLRVKTRYFVDRTKVFEEIDEFLAKTSGYFVIRAEGGMGKTTVAAKYVIENDKCLYHFLSRELGPGERKPAGYAVGSPRNNIESCLAMLCQQLQDWLDVPLGVTTDLKILENRFNKLLALKSEKRPQDKLVIVIDGIDEAKELKTFFDYFPERPPAGVYFILTTRPLVEIPKHLEASSIELGYLNQDDIREMVAQADDSLADNDKFIEDLYAVTGGHPLYLYHVVEEVSDLGEGARQYVEQIPARAVKNLEGYYRWQLEKLVESTLADERKAGQDTLDLLRTLALLREAVTGAQLKEITGITGNDYIKAYRKASRYLIDRTVDGMTLYSLFHLRFQEVVRDDYQRLTKKERIGYLQKILDYCRAGRERGEQDAPGGNDYIFRHYAEHLYEFGQEVRDFDPLFELLSDSSFLTAKIKRFGRFSSILPDVQIGLEAAASSRRWQEALRFSLLEGFVREAVKFKWSTGAILLDAIKGEVELALSEARAISVLDERALQMLLIAEWLLRSDDAALVRKGHEIMQEIAGMWLVTKPYVTYLIEEEIMDFVTRVLFDHDRAMAGSFVGIINTPGSPQELSLLLILARLDREGAFADPPDSAITAAEYEEIISSVKEVCTTYLARRIGSSYGEKHDPPLVEGTLKDESLAKVFFRLATGNDATEMEVSQVYRSAEEVLKSGLPADDRELRALLKTVWQFWRDYGEGKFHRALPQPQRFVDEIRQLKGFMPIYKHLRAYLPVLTKEFAEQVSPMLKGQARTSPPFSDLLRFYLVKEAAGNNPQIAENIRMKIMRPRLRAAACAYVIKSLSPDDVAHKSLLVASTFSDLQAEDHESKELLYFDYDDEIVHAVSVIGCADETMDWMSVLRKHFYEDEVLLMTSRVVFGVGGEKIISTHGPEIERRLKYWSYEIYDEDDLRHAPSSLAELARISEEIDFQSLTKFLQSVKDYCARNHYGDETPESRQVFQSVFTNDSFILFLENLARKLNDADLVLLLSFVQKNLTDPLRKFKVISQIAVRHSQLGDAQRAEAVTDEVVDAFDMKIPQVGISTYDLRHHVLPILTNIHRINYDKASSAIERLSSAMGLEMLAVQAREATGPFAADLFFVLASVADKIGRYDLRDKYLQVAESSARRVSKWDYEMTLNRIGHDLQGMRNPQVMNSLLLLVQSSKQFEGAATNYQTALAHAAAHFARGLITLAQEPLREINMIDSVLDDIALEESDSAELLGA